MTVAQDQKVWGSIPSTGHVKECRAVLIPYYFCLSSSDGYLADENCVRVAQAACIVVWHVSTGEMGLLKWCVSYNLHWWRYLRPLYFLPKYTSVREDTN